MAPKKKSSSLPQPIPIGNCEVVVEAKNFTTKLDQNSLQISLSKKAKVNISVMESGKKKNCDNIQNYVTDGSHRGNLYFVLVNSKDVGSEVNSQLQHVLNLYIKELPAMNFAANTGKQSMFLERCVTNGKFCTLLLKSKAMEHSGEVVAAVTYQIIPADTRYAEVPLAAVSSIYQRKGIGSLLYRELSKRLKSVGIRTIFCWGDKESEGFWLKQGFVSIGEVDTKGKVRRLPIKADIRRTLCFPGGSTLMVSHLSMDRSANSEEPLKPCYFRPLESPLPSDTAPNHGVGGREESPVPQAVENERAAKNELCLPKELVKNNFQLDGTQGIVHHEGMEIGNTENALELTRTGVDAGDKQCSCSSLGEKKRVWELSYTSLKSKKIKGGHQVYCQLDSWGFVPESDGRNNSGAKSSTEISMGRSLIEENLRDPFTGSCFEKTTEDCQWINSQDQGSKELPSRGRGSFVIMLMNIADDAKKSSLSKIIEKLGGTVTSDGSLSTHVVTGKVRKTLNFCMALCSGAWIISPRWLKESFRKGRYVDEMAYILKDEEYEFRYKIELKDAVQRARDRPRALLKGYKVCLAAHLQPPVHILSAIITSAGGDVSCGLEKVNRALETIFLACEEDMEEAMCAIKKGLRTFSSDWFMNCIMRQELDLDAPQFAESL